MSVVAIHQPNFFPWLGYFDKIVQCDTFVFLDHVQFQKTGGTWSNRVRMLIGGDVRWVTAAIDRNYTGTREIREMRFLSENPWRQKMLTSLNANYKRHPFYEETMALVEPLLLNQESNIAEYNVHAVTKIALRLGIDTGKMTRASEYKTSSSSNELLCELTLQAGGDAYLCGGGADGYQDESLFERQGLKLLYQDFSHPVYTQRGQAEFVPGLSVIDAAMNLGWDSVGKLLEMHG